MDTKPIIMEKTEQLYRIDVLTLNREKDGTSILAFCQGEAVLRFTDPGEFEVLKQGLVIGWELRADIDCICRIYYTIKSSLINQMVHSKN